MVQKEFTKIVKPDVRMIISPHVISYEERLGSEIRGYIVVDTISGSIEACVTGDCATFTLKYGWQYDYNPTCAILTKIYAFLEKVRKPPNKRAKSLVKVALENLEWEIKASGCKRDRPRYKPPRLRR